MRREWRALRDSNSRPSGFRRGGLYPAEQEEVFSSSNSCNSLRPLPDLKNRSPPHGIAARIKGLGMNHFPGVVVPSRFRNSPIMLPQTMLNIRTVSRIQTSGRATPKNINPKHGVRTEWRALRDSNSRPSGS